MHARARRPRVVSAAVARILARPAPVLPPEHVLFKLAEPKRVEEHWNWPEPLSGLYLRQRRACVLRAWCALRMMTIDPACARGWRDEVRRALQAARHFRRAAANSLARGR